MPGNRKSSNALWIDDRRGDRVGVLKECKQKKAFPTSILKPSSASIDRYEELLLIQSAQLAPFNEIWILAMFLALYVVQCCWSPPSHGNFLASIFPQKKDTREFSEGDYLSVSPDGRYRIELSLLTKPCARAKCGGCKNTFFSK